MLYFRVVISEIPLDRKPRAVFDTFEGEGRAEHPPEEPHHPVATAPIARDGKVAETTEHSQARVDAILVNVLRVDGEGGRFEGR